MTASLVRTSYLLLLCSALAPSVAWAQPLVVAWSVSDEDVRDVAAETIAAHDAMPTDTARAALEAVSSTPPASIPAETFDRWSSLVRQAVRSLAQGDREAASAQLREADAISLSFALDLNRDAARASRVLDACLFDVRARLEMHDETASARALVCRQRAPQVVPTPYLHPPEVLALFDAVIASASLHVESPTACLVRLNGVALGETPLDVDALAPGDYALQVECDAAPGRVHAITVSEAASARIDARLDAVVRTEPVLRLSYATQADADARREQDALALGALLDATETWLVGLEGEAVRVDLPAAPTPIASSPDYDRAPWEIGTGIGLGVLGLGAVVSSGALIGVGAGYGQLATQPLPTDPDYLARRAQWTGWEMPALALGWISGALFTSALPLLLPHERGVPEWSWWIGGVGVAVIGAGLALALAPSSCGNERPTASCVDATAMIDAGSMIASLGAPLIGVPLTHLFTQLIGGSITPSVSASPSGGSIGVEGAW